MLRRDPLSDQYWIEVKKKKVKFYILNYELHLFLHGLGTKQY